MYSRIVLPAYKHRRRRPKEVICEFYLAANVDLFKDGALGETAQQSALTIDALLPRDAGSPMHVNKDLASRCLKTLMVHCRLHGFMSKKGLPVTFSPYWALS